MDFVVVVTAALEPTNTDKVKQYVSECARVLNNGGLLFVQGRPEYLPTLGVFLDQHLTFKYWIAVESALQARRKGLPSVHAAVLLFTKGSDRFNIRPARFPHQHCAFCGRPLRDWGGKGHLMHPEGRVVSDVWTELPHRDNYTQLSSPVIHTILRMIQSERREVRGVIGPREGVRSFVAEAAAEPFLQYELPGLEPEVEYESVTHDLVKGMFNVVHCGDAVQILKRYPDACIDLAFADPPYNLQKAYNAYHDGQENRRYIGWCNS
ncbi:hypothetical protein FJY63_10155, partial [Candidatus Sumerlaeota bacterium]|nr:hypothetical protein [Candidatus Sumerlaeota bacterium]